LMPVKALAQKYMRLARELPHLDEAIQCRRVASSLPRESWTNRRRFSQSEAGRGRPWQLSHNWGETAALLQAEWQSFTSCVQLTVGTARQDVCLAVACGCWVAEYCQRRLAIGL
jgi:hypothetical protein